MVKGIEGIGAQLQMHVLGNRNVLVHPDVEVRVVRPPQVVPAARFQSQRTAEASHRGSLVLK